MPAEPSKTSIIPFDNKGLISKVDGRAIPYGTFQYLYNLMSEVEGSVTTRRGRKLLGFVLAGSECTFIHKLVASPIPEVPGSPTSNPRYLQQGGNIIRTPGGPGANAYANSSYTAVANNVCLDPVTSNNSTLWSAADYSTGATGNPWAFFACQNAMLKDNGIQLYNPLYPWGIPPAAGVVQASVASGGNNNNGAGNLDGGANGSPAGSLPYSWVFTWRSVVTTNEGNPSQFMKSDSQVSNGTPLAVNNNCVAVTYYGCYNNSTTNPEITGNQAVAIYRAGGTFADSIYRLVGYASNPGGGNSAVFVDNASDASIDEAPQVFYDNNPPVVSSLTTPIVTTFAANNTAGLVAASLAGNNLGLTPGSTIYITAGGIGSNNSTLSNFEYSTVLSVAPSGANTTVEMYIQYNHVIGDVVTCVAVSGQPCTLTCEAFDALFVAGDPNNPQTLYMSKTGLPESFPIIDATGVAHSINVGSPSNPIVGLCEFRGNVVCLNSQNIFEVPVFEGQMYSPNATPAQRGLVAAKAWCLVDNEIWYLAYDGIYAWNGGESVKKTDAIDQLFHNIATQVTPGGVYYPVDYGQVAANALLFVRMEYYRDQVHFFYHDTTGGPIDLYYERSTNRWLPNLKSISNGPQTAIYVERDVGNLIYVRKRGPGNNGFSVSVDDALDGTGLTSDEWSGNNGASGQAINGTAVTGWLDMGNQYVPKIFDEVWLDADMESGNNSVAVSVFYDYQSNNAQDSFLVNTANNGRQWIALDLNVQPDTTQANNAVSSFGRQASVLSFLFNVASQGARSTLYGMKFKYRELAELTAAPYYDWTDCGSKFDKRFYELSVEFDTNVWNYAGNTANATAYSHTLVLDTITGVSGNNTNLGVQTWTITNAITTILSPGRGLVTLPFHDTVGGSGNNASFVAKMVRLRANPTLIGSNNAGVPSTNYFRILAIDFKTEAYPPDIVPFCEWEDGGNPFEKYANQIIFEVDTGGVAASVVIQGDGTTTQTISVNTTWATRDLTLTLFSNVQARKWRWIVTPGVGGKFQVFKSQFLFQPADKGAVVHSGDWDDLGHPYDKYLQTVVLEYDLSSQGPLTIQMDTLTGIGGNNITLAAQTFPLVLPSNNTNARTKTEFGIAAGTIAKMVRFYPVPGGGGNNNLVSSYRQWKYAVTKIDYPPDIILSSDWEDDGSPFEKYANQLIMEVDTGGQNASLIIQGDGNNTQTLTINTTWSTRDLTLTLLSNLQARKWRWVSSPGVGGKFQVFSHKFLFQPADKGPVGHSFDWDDLGHPYDKLLQTVVIEYDTSFQGNLSLQMDTLSGIGGNNYISAVQTFPLSLPSNNTNARCKTEFGIAADTIIKMIRLYPVQGGNNGLVTNYKQWKYTFTKVDYPPDQLFVTEWRLAQSDTDKEPSWLSLDMDTNGIPATVLLQNELSAQPNGFVISVQHTGTSTDRVVNYAIPADTRAKMWRLKLAPGATGKTQLFGWNFERWKPFSLVGPIDPPESILATPWTDLGYPYTKAPRNLILDINTGGNNLAVTLQSQESGNVQNFIINSTIDTRHQVIACNNSNSTGTLWRMLLAAPGANIYGQLWNWQLDYVREPAAVTFVDTFEQDFGFNGFKWLKQWWVDFQGSADVTMTILVDNDVEFYTVVLSPQTNRGMQRGYFPAVNGGVLNKSKIYRVQFSSTANFQLYADTKLEWAPWNRDMRASFQQFKITSEQQVAAS